MKGASLAALLLAVTACKNDEPAPPTKERDELAQPSVTSNPDDAAVDPATLEENAHDVVFSDRATQAYLLLLRPGRAAPTRAELAALVKRKLDDGPEVAKLVELVEREPVAAQGGTPELGGPDAEERARVQRLDVLGLHIELLSLEGPEAPIPPEHLQADVLVRGLSTAERESLPERTRALLLRAQYRNRDALRGLRLLQTLVRIAAVEHDALVYDADTQETLGPAAFGERRLRSGLGNVADQIVVVPFSDPRHGEGHVRLTTRGMRRFGSVDLELDGLPSDPEVLQRASDFLQGLAYRMVRMGEVDVGGYASQVDETFDVTLDDVRHAYSGRGAKIEACDACPQRVSVHLVERAPEPHDPAGHVVARVVAPRDESDAAGYDHPAWVRRAIGLVFG